MRDRTKAERAMDEANRRLWKWPTGRVGRLGEYGALVQTAEKARRAVQIEREKGR